MPPHGRFTESPHLIDSAAATSQASFSLIRRVARRCRSAPRRACARC